MDQPKLFYDSKERTYFLNECFCESCKSDLCSGDVFFLVSQFSKKFCSHNVLCLKCVRSLKKVGVVTEIKQGFIVDDLPDCVVPAVLCLPQLKAMKDDKIIQDVFSASNIETIHTKDRTKFSNRVSIQGANIGKYSEFELMKDRELLSDEEIKQDLLELKKARCEDEYK